MTKPGKNVRANRNILLDLMDKDIALKIQHELNKKGVKIITDVELSEIKKISFSINLLEIVLLLNVVMIVLAVMPFICKMAFFPVFLFSNLSL